MSKLKLDALETVSGEGKITLKNQLKGMTAESMPAGSVLQVISSASTAYDTTTSTSFVASSLLESITPISSSSKIVVTISGGAMDFGSGTQILINLYRSINGASYTDISPLARTKIGSATWSLNHSYSYLDSPNTASSVSYKPYYKSFDGGTMHFNNAYGIPITITLTEIKG